MPLVAVAGALLLLQFAGLYPPPLRDPARHRAAAFCRTRGGVRGIDLGYAAVRLDRVLHPGKPGASNAPIMKAAVAVPPRCRLVARHLRDQVAESAEPGRLAMKARAGVVPRVDDRREHLVGPWIKTPYRCTRP